jgi:GNAT superfamily N-acetyltransferase
VVAHVECPGSSRPHAIRRLNLPHPVRESRLDSERFGVLVFRAEIRNKHDLAAFLRQYRSLSADLVIVRTPHLQQADAESLRDLGFECLEQRETWVRSLSELPEARCRWDLEEAGTDQLEAVRDLARECFREYNGHYHNDSRLPDALCTEAYADWASRLCTKEPDSVLFVCRDNDTRLVGFGHARKQSASTAHFELTGVLPGHRGKGIHHAMLLQRMKWARARGCRQVLVRGHTENDRVRRNWAQAGFRFVTTEMTWHGWRGNLINPAPR